MKWFNVKKGWGFIIGENGEDIFVHQSGVNKAGFRSLDDGEMVEYEIRNTDKGPEACNITGPQGRSRETLLKVAEKDFGGVAVPVGTGLGLFGVGAVCRVRS